MSDGAGVLNGEDPEGHVVVDVGADAAPAVVTLRNQVTAVAEDVSTASALKVADIAMADGELGTDGLSLTGLDAGMFEIVGNAVRMRKVRRVKDAGRRGKSIVQRLRGRGSVRMSTDAILALTRGER